MKALILDTETTGLPFHPSAPIDRQPRIIEFAATLLDTETGESESFSRLFNPGESLEPIITKITGLTDDDLAEEPPIDLDWIAEIIAAADAVVAHNLPFDAFLIASEFARAGRDLEWPRALICTAQEFTPVFGYRPKMKEVFQWATGEPLEQTHRALDDVDVLVEALNAIGYFDVITEIQRQDRVHISQDIRPDQIGR